MTLGERFREIYERGDLDLPHPGSGQTALRHKRLLEIARSDLALARLCEAHVDAVAILAEIGRTPEPGALYGVWASESAAGPLELRNNSGRLTLNGSKMFCTGGGLLDRALVTVTIPEHYLVDVDLKAEYSSLVFDTSGWKTTAFAETQTASTTFLNTPIADGAVIGKPRWYLERPGFWHGACGPAASWAGGAIQLVDYATAQRRNDPHTLAHLGAMTAQAWALEAYLQVAGGEIDADPNDCSLACERALKVRHLTEEACSDVLKRLGRAYGPRVLAFDEKVLRCYHELELYIRQSHAEQDLEELGRMARLPSSS